MLAIHAVDMDGKAVYEPVNDPVAEATVITPTDENIVSLVKNSTNTGLVGIFSDNPANQGWGEDKVVGMANRSIILALKMTRWGYFTGVTVTKL